MDAISVAQAATLINVTIVIVRLSYPLLLSMVATGTLRNEVNAATWSVFGRLINGSHWPTLLRTDTVSSRKVDLAVNTISQLSAAVTILLGIASGLTPLGLYPIIELRSSDKVVFTYVRDNSYIGLATPSHEAYITNRICGFYFDESCPGNDDGYFRVDNDTHKSNIGSNGSNLSISTSIATNITGIFRGISTEEKSTIASAFDIHYRSFINYNNQTEPSESENVRWFDEGRPRTQGRFRYLQSFVLNNKDEAVEGLIVSTTNRPGIGLRNHTLPLDSTLGYTWPEELLWLEPETACTDLNITYEYTMPVPSDHEYDSNSMPTGRLVDRGGIVGLPMEYPLLDHEPTQSNAQLLSRSWRAAVITNWILARTLNETRSDTVIGKEYYLGDYSAADSLYRDPQPDSIAVSSYGSAQTTVDAYNPGLPGPLSILRTKMNASRSDLTKGGTDMDPDIGITWGGSDQIDISHMASVGGLLLGAGSKLDKKDNAARDAQQYQIDPGSNWTHPLFSCVTAMKASVKTVIFEINGTASVSNLVVKHIEDKKYGPSDPPPVWAVEETDRELDSISPFWGIVKDDYVDAPGVQTIRQPHLYLPAGKSSVASIAGIESGDAVAGLSAPLSVLRAVYGTDNLGSESSLHRIADFTGAVSWPLFAKWSELSSSANTAGSIINLVWTDLMANTVVSSKGILSRSGMFEPPATSAELTASRYVKGVAYDWRFAGPALLFAFIYMALLLCSIIMLCTHRLSFAHLRFVLNHTSAGRAMTTERFEAETQADRGSTDCWAEIRGDETVRLTRLNGDDDRKRNSSLGH